MKRFLLTALLAFTFLPLAAIADPAPVPHFSKVSPGPGEGRVHIESVEVQELRGRLWMVVTLRNRGDQTVHSGLVSIVAEHPLSSVVFRGLTPGSSQRLRIPFLATANSDRLDVGVTIDPGSPTVSEAWDGVWHRVSPITDGGGRVTGFRDLGYAR